MLKVLTVLIAGWCACIYAEPTTSRQLIENLSARMHTLPHREGSLIKSFTNHSQSYIYDQALAIISFSKANEKNKARLLLLGLESLQMKDGSLYFSYYLDGKSPYPKEGGDKRFAGAIAWVALAATHYQNTFQSQEFVSFNKKILSYLKNQMASFKMSGKTYRGIKFAPKDIKATSWNEGDTIALEHNLDAYAAYKHFAKVNKTKKWNREIQSLKTFVMSMWDSTRDHFWSGANAKTGAINKSELYLDNQSWSLLALEKDSLKSISPDLALELNCESFYVEKDKIAGFMDSKPVRGPASSEFIWSEGSLGQILAMKKIGSKCNNKSPDEFLISILQMRTKDGGVQYSTATPNPDFTTASSVAGTAWLYFALSDFNPFEII